MKILTYILFFLPIFAFSQVDCVKVHSDFSGFCLEYHQNGQISWVKEFANGSATGIWMLFNEKGNLTKQVNCIEKSDSSTLISKMIDLNSNQNQIAINAMKSDKINHIKREEEIIDLCGFGEDAYYPGGEKAMLAWIQKKIIYPEISIKNSERGRVYIDFIVEIDGKISNVKVVRGVSFDIDNEARRIIESMPNWEPAVYKKSYVRGKMRIPINFELR